MYHAETSTDAPIKVYSPSMTGKKLRKALGMPVYPRVCAKKSFKVYKKFSSIKKADRIAYLKKMSKVVEERLSFSEVRSARNHFNHISEDCPCYCCSKKAVVRHHVIPLVNGGRNRANNIVPLCNNCHLKCHPHMDRTKRISVGDTLKKALSGYGAVASWNSVQPQINGPLVSMQEKQVGNLAAAGA